MRFDWFHPIYLYMWNTLDPYYLLVPDEVFVLLESIWRLEDATLNLIFSVAYYLDLHVLYLFNVYGLFLLSKVVDVL